MIKIIRTSFLILILFCTQHSWAQYTILHTPDTLQNIYQIKKIAHYGDKALFLISAPTPYIIQTDGTPQGTKNIGPYSYNQKFIQISLDSLIRIFDEDSLLNIQLFLANQDQPMEYSLDQFNYLNYKFANNKLILRSTNAFTILDFQDGSHFTKTYPDENFGNEWILCDNNIIIAEVGGESKIFKIAINDLSITSIPASTSPFTTTDLIRINDSLFLYSVNDSLFSSNTETSLFLRTLPDVAYFYWNVIHTKNTLYFSYLDFNYQSHVLRTDGTVDGTIILKSFLISPFMQVELFKINDQAYFTLNDSLWTSDGTVTGTKKALQTNIYKFIYEPFIAKNGHIAYYSLDQGGVRHPYVFDGNTPKKIYSELKDEANYGWQNSLNSVIIGPENAYLPLVDINYGRELHRYNFETNKTTMVHDFTPNAIWSDIRPLGEINNHIIFLSRQNHKYQLMSFNDNSPDVAPTPIQKNYNWAESILLNSYIHNYETVVDNNGNYYNSMYEANPQRSNYLVYNRQLLNPIQNNKIIKLNSQGEFDWAISFPNQNQAIPIATNNQNELIAGIFLNNNTLIQGQNFDPSNGNLLLLTFNESGQILRSKQFDIGPNGQVDDVAISKDNQVYITGKFSGKTAEFDQHTIQSERNIATFLLKLSNTGQTIWGNAYPLPFAWPIDKAVSPIAIGQKQIYFLQRIGDAQRLLQCKNTRHRFRINAVQQSTGKTLWENEYISKDFSFPIDLAASSKEHLTLIGSYMEEIQFDNTILTSDSCNQTNFFQIKIAPQGTLLEAKRLATDYTFLTQVTYDKTDNMYLVGTKIDSSYFGVNQVLDTSGFQPSTRFSHNQISISKYNSLGSLSKSITFHQNTTTSNIQGYYSNLSPSLEFTPDNKAILTCNPYSMLDTFNVLYATSYYQRLFMLQFDLDHEQVLTLDGHLGLPDISIYPNPVEDYLNIKSVTDMDFTQTAITVYTIDGKQWSLPTSKNHGHVKIHTASLPQGVYVVAIQLGDQVLAQKFVKK